MRRSTSDGLAVAGEWGLKGLAVANVVFAIVTIFGGGFFAGTALAALAALQYLAAFMLKVEVRSPVLPIAMAATALGALLMWRDHFLLALGSFGCVALASWAWMNLPRSR